MFNTEEDGCCCYLKTTVHLNSCDFEEVSLFSSRPNILNEDLSTVNLDNISFSNGCPQTSPLKPILIQYSVPLPFYCTWVWWHVADKKEEGPVKLYPQNLNARTDLIYTGRGPNMGA